MEIRDDNHAKVFATYKREANILLETDLMETSKPRIPVVPVKTPNVVPVKTPNVIQVKNPNVVQVKTSKFFVPMKPPVVISSMDPPPVYTKVSLVVKAPSVFYAPKAASNRNQGSVKSYNTTIPNLPVASSSSLPSLVNAKRDPDDDSNVSNTSKKSKKTAASAKQRAMDKGYNYYLANQSYDDPNMCI